MNIFNYKRVSKISTYLEAAPRTFPDDIQEKIPVFEHFLSSIEGLMPIFLLKMDSLEMGFFNILKRFKNYSKFWTAILKHNKLHACITSPIKFHLFFLYSLFIISGLGQIDDTRGNSPRCRSVGEIWKVEIWQDAILLGVNHGAKFS